jgi:hypothetical protein
LLEVDEWDAELAGQRLGDLLLGGVALLDYDPAKSATGLLLFLEGGADLLFGQQFLL